MQAKVSTQTNLNFTTMELKIDSFERVGVVVQAKVSTQTNLHFTTMELKIDSFERVGVVSERASFSLA